VPTAYLDLAISIALDLAILILLAFVFYYRRHHQREFAVAISIMNIVLFALAGALASYTLSLGVGFALFSVISIMRLRSDTAGWIEMTYLLIALATGLIVGLPGYSIVDKAIYGGILVLAIFVIDSQLLLRDKRVVRVNATVDFFEMDSDRLKDRVEKLVLHRVDEVNVKSFVVEPPSMKLEIRYNEQIQLAETDVEQA
jgi:hypothetical protein